ncbi:RNA polymerase sigma factor [Gemmata sp. SH-PL17]|uniref:RNA polymerase sigma factor n=1 Tax=Gemmata sp. SH-PL17 TaxID=1630693 RepID=UPI00078D628D|nr:sigma-70 family RNA polymerase sigma factor [Gemmata sp. SH-PL17]AMV24046.1 RNA polymerase sigma factor [Gemmata sp. SH-PL17]
MGSGTFTFVSLLERFRGGDPEAAGNIYAEYGGVIRAAVRRHLPDRLRKEYDSLDFAQDVWASFCRLAGGSYHFATPEELGGFLARVARNKVIDVCRRRFETQAFNVRREHPLTRRDGADIPVSGREPTPSKWAMAAERWTAIAAQLPPQHLVVVARLREGFTQQEVAELTGITDRTVRRIVERVREICEDEL